MQLIEKGCLCVFVIKFERSKMQGKAPKGLLEGRQHPLEKALPAAVPTAEWTGN